VLWRIPLGEGHAGPAVHKGRVFLVDYDNRPGKREDAIRCLSLADGSEIWRYTYSVVVKPQHGMSRTVPAVNDRYVVALGPRGHVHCLEMETGTLVWKLDMVKDCGTRIPSWYTGQCPLIDGDVAVLAPGGDPLMMAVELATGKVRWKTPNPPASAAADSAGEGPGDWGMTHSSVAVMDLAGTRQYLYCTTKGVVGVDARDGRILWTHPWTIGYAVVPMPVFIPPDRVFLSGGYRAESVMLKLTAGGGSVSVEELFRCPPETFGSEQQTPILYQDHLYAVIPRGRGQLACMDVDGHVKWASGFDKQFHLGPFMLADGLLLVLSSHGEAEGTLFLVEARPDASGYHELARAKVLNGHDCWGPMVLVNGKLLLRDSNERACIRVGWREP
jgi:outer membrane protein assembly factor BamB